MKPDKPARLLKFIARDTFAVLALITLIMVGVDVANGPSAALRFSELFNSSANAGELARPVADADVKLIAPKAMTSEGAQAAGGARAASNRAAMLGLAMVFSVLVAFNLAIFRHLRRVYASPRRSGWRRG